jgi:hypothetical protein
MSYGQYWDILLGPAVLPGAIEAVTKEVANLTGVKSVHQLARITQIANGGSYKEKDQRASKSGLPCYYNVDGTPAALRSAGGAPEFCAASIRYRQTTRNGT